MGPREIGKLVLNCAVFQSLTVSYRLIGLTKLSDANNAGGKHGSKCTLILTEGDSAKALAVAGLSVVGRDNFGVFPLRGKLLNVRDARHDQIMKNEEIQNIKKIMGLQHNKDYKDVNSLRYGRLMIMTDQVCNTVYASTIPDTLPGSRWVAYQGVVDQFLGAFFPVSAEGARVFGRVCHAYSQGQYYA